MPERILILGGTREAVALAKKLVDQGHFVTTSLAGRTKEPLPVAGQTRTGGFGGIGGLADYLTSETITRLVDATHPFAQQISANAVEAAQLAGVPLDIRTRKPWERADGDRWIEVNTLQAAAAAIPTGARVLLALGSQHLSAFHARDDVFFLVRMVDAPPTPLPFADHTVLLGRPKMTADAETKILQDAGITHIVCRNSGGAGAYAKVQAARHLGLPVIMVQR